jgi:hypothetical protein
MRRFYSFLALLCLKFITVVSVAEIAKAQAVAPFNACTFSSPKFAAQSFAGGRASSGCANWSVARGRNGCTKTKGPCPLCVTTAPGESVFTVSADGILLKKHLELANRWLETSTVSAGQKFKRSLPDSVSGSTFWNARILVMPYGNLMGSFAPLPGIYASDVPTCYAGISEFFPSQWNYNAVDAPYAFAWAPVGSGLCNSPHGGTLMGGLEAAKGKASSLGLGKSFKSAPGEVCARPVGFAEASLKNLRPNSDALAPLTAGPQEISSKLCMGSWGNLLPRTGWSVTADPLLSALQAAYKFTSITADFNLNDNWKTRTDDSWQIVFPNNVPGSCFAPGAQFPIVATAPLEDMGQRGRHELELSSQAKGSYVIAVWRKRETCEEPLESIGGWTAAHRANLVKNTTICNALHAQGGAF